MNVTAEEIINNFKLVYPDDSILVYKAEKGWSHWYHGRRFVKVTLEDGQWLLIYKLLKSSKSDISSEEIMTKAFPFVFDTKSEKDPVKRRDALRDQLQKVFPDHHVSVFVTPGVWQRGSNNITGSASFIKEYGTNVDIILN
jgi:hypothetical protein